MVRYEVRCTGNKFFNKWYVWDNKEKEVLQKYRSEEKAQQAVEMLKRIK